MYSESGSVFIEPLMSNSHLHKLHFTYERRLLIIFEDSLDPQNIVDLFILRLKHIITCSSLKYTVLSCEVRTKLKVQRKSRSTPSVRFVTQKKSCK